MRFLGLADYDGKMGEIYLKNRLILPERSRIVCFSKCQWSFMVLLVGHKHFCPNLCFFTHFWTKTDTISAFP
jgi:hypothetical protein